MRKVTLLISVIANLLFGCAGHNESKDESKLRTEKHAACKDLSPSEIQRRAVIFMTGDENKCYDYKMNMVTVNDSISRLVLRPNELTLGGNVALEWNVLTCSFSVLGRGK